MKIRKKATQQNVKLDKDFYSYDEIIKMNRAKEIVYFDWSKSMNEMYRYDAEDKFDWDIEFSIFTEDLEEIKVELDCIGHYRNVAIGKNGKKYYIKL